MFERELEERIKGLEDEVKLLKNEIQQTLLDIRERLAEGYPPPQPERLPATEAISNKGSLDFSTITALSNWLGEKVRKVGSEQLLSLLELYQLTGRLPAKLKEVMVRVIQSAGHYEKGYPALLVELKEILEGRGKP